ncbi:MAG: ornithine carbamoyltransferase [Candidatus Bipolaricaulota bacterium]|nr:ornithine carbamoyltransferase [Candidatus Bipolaricaulota bacterium]
MHTKDIVSLALLSTEDIYEILETARNLKLELRAGVKHGVLAGKGLAMIFQKPSLRTRVSFENGMSQLGGHAIYLGPDDIRLGKRETTEDIAIVLSGYVDGIMARVFDHQTVVDLARYASVPVINGLSDLLHPCQVLGDMLTIWEKKRRLEGLMLTFIGDGNNVAHSLINVCTKLGMRFRIACPEGYDPNEEIITAARSAGGDIEVFHDPKDAANGADVLYTDVWASMGQEAQAEDKKHDFTGFTLDEDLIELANDDALIMHCLPAHYAEEITYAASRARGSAIFDQAENRMHAQKAILVLLMS